MERTQLEQQLVAAMEEMREKESASIASWARRRALLTAGEGADSSSVFWCEAVYALSRVVFLWLRRSPDNDAARAFLWVLGIIARCGNEGTINSILPSVPGLLGIAERQYFGNETSIDPRMMSLLLMHIA